MMRKIIIVVLGSLPFLNACSNQQKESNAVSPDHFIHVKDTHFEKDGTPYHFMGANFWYGINLGSKGEGGDQQRLIRELDRMEKIGITNLRIMGMSEGPDDEPYRMTPSVQEGKGVFREELLEGLDFLLVEMAKRKMHAVICMSNFWPWSGGFGQYVQWTRSQDTIPYPPPHPNGSFDVYQKFVASIYSNELAMSYYYDALDKVIQRKNTINQIPYVEDPTIMAWELCNEPRSIDQVNLYLQWIDSASSHIKKLAPKQLITVGSEGETGSPAYSGTDFEKTHSNRNIDYTTVHIWIQNWEWYDPKKHHSTFPSASARALDYLRRHAVLSKKLNKPYVLEEFGIMKDDGSFDPKATNLHRDAFYELMFKEVSKLAKDSMAAGVNFWAWGGEGRPTKPQGWWKAKDDFIGDPPHEEQGWYSVYDTDSSTLNLIQRYAKVLKSL